MHVIGLSQAPATSYSGVAKEPVTWLGKHCPGVATSWFARDAQPLFAPRKHATRRYAHTHSAHYTPALVCRPHPYVNTSKVVLRPGQEAEGMFLPYYT